MRETNNTGIPAALFLLHTPHHFILEHPQCKGRTKRTWQLSYYHLNCWQSIALSPSCFLYKQSDVETSPNTTPPPTVHIWKAQDRNPQLTAGRGSDWAHLCPSRQVHCHSISSVSLLLPAPFVLNICQNTKNKIQWKLRLTPDFYTFMTAGRFQMHFWVCKSQLNVGFMYSPPLYLLGEGQESLLTSHLHHTMRSILFWSRQYAILPSSNAKLI